MNENNKLYEVESLFGKHEKQDWRPVIDYVQSLLTQNPENVEISIRIIYILHNILVEEQYTDKQHDEISSLLKTYFEASYRKFAESPEYLFFVGKILHVAEWYFGLNDDLNPLEEKLAFKMQKKAFELEPNNRIYEWAFRFSKGEKKNALTLSKELLYDEQRWVKWLKTKGFPGKYIIEGLEYCYENYKLTI